jgi:hypothetical protein
MKISLAFYAMLTVFSQSPAHLLSPEQKSELWKFEKIVLMVLGGLFGLFSIMFIFTCIGLRGRPRDFDSIMVDNTDLQEDSEDRGYTSPTFARQDKKNV